MIDIHCHLNFHKFTSDYEEVIQKALDSGVTKIVNVGTSIASSQHAVELADTHDALYAIVGIHPHHADDVQKDPQWIKTLESLTKHKKVIGIGEIGLDYFEYQSNGVVDPLVQKQVFLDQVNLAAKVSLPLQIHNRLAGEDVVAILQKYKHLLLPDPGMFHCFAASKQVHEDVLALGFSIGFDGNITYPGLAPKETVRLEDLAIATPLDKLLCETDSPYLTPIPLRGQRNEPANVMLVAEAIAKIKQVPMQNVIDQTTKNAYTIFTRLLS